MYCTVNFRVISRLSYFPATTDKHFCPWWKLVQFTTSLSRAHNADIVWSCHTLFLFVGRRYDKSAHAEHMKPVFKSVGTNTKQNGNYICTSLCTISSLVIRCVVRFRSCIRVFRLCDHSFRISLDSLWELKVTTPAGRSILANTVLDTTSSERNSSVSWRRKRGRKLLARCWEWL